jgi:peptide/nickel transport system ATP-binding protein
MTALTVEDLRVVVGAGRRSFPAVDGVGLVVPRGRVVGLVGESGSGKSTLARAIVGLHPVESGRVLVGGVDVTRRKVGQRGVQMVFQDTYGSLNPRMTVADIVREGLVRHESGRPADVRAELVSVLAAVSLDERYLDRRPRELSGGQRQRVAIARALAVGSRVLIADEITSALDVSVQAQVLNLLRDVVRDNDLSMLFISHNLAVINFICDDVAVMHCGSVVERAATDDLFSAPQHPYTRSLLAAVPRLRGGSRETWLASGEPVDPRHAPTGCRFHPQCPVGPAAHPDRIECITIDPRDGAPGRAHHSSCHFTDQEVANVPRVHAEP